jgi:hypothetical protein
MRGFDTTKTEERSDLIANAARTTKLTCWNCGKLGSHRSPECERSKHRCTICGKDEHLEEFCQSAKDKSPDANTKRSRYAKGNNDAKNKLNNSQKAFSKQGENRGRTSPMKKGFR